MGVDEEGEMTVPQPEYTARARDMQAFRPRLIKTISTREIERVRGTERMGDGGDGVRGDDRGTKYREREAGRGGGRGVRGGWQRAVEENHATLGVHGAG